MLLAVLISTLVQIMYMADVMTAFFTVYNNGLPQDPDLVIRNEQILKKYIKRYDWIQLNTYVYCCGLVTVDDLFGNLTEWQGPSCSNPHASSCVEIIPISCLSVRSPSFTPPHYKGTRYGVFDNLFQLPRYGSHPGLQLLLFTLLRPDSLRP